MAKLKVVELFAGVGGFRLGLEGYNGKSSSSSYTKKLKSNYEVVWSNQFEPSTKTQHANIIYETRWPEANHFGGDLNEVVGPDVPEKITLDNIPEHDLLVGGFPCQDYSVAGVNTKGIQGKKGVLWWNIHRLLEIRKPKYILLENVDRLLKSPTNQRGRDFAIVLATLADLGYDVEWQAINAADYGMPQRRRRVFILGVHKNADFNLPEIGDWMVKGGVLSKAFPHEPKTNIDKKFLKGNPDKITKEYEDGKFMNAGIMVNRDVVSYDYKAPEELDDKYSDTSKIKDILLDHNKVPQEFFVDATKKLKKPLIKKQKIGAHLSYLDLDDNYTAVLKSELDKWKYLKGKKAEERISSKGVFYYTEGPLSLSDSIDKPSRTIITSEGGPGASRFKHLIEIKEGVKYRRLTPIELEKLNMFPENHTLHEAVSDNKRAFFMGNALVVGIVEKIGLELQKQIS